MEKSKKNIGAKIAAALVAVTALTCCVVGTTFAKYTSATNATANAAVAKWQVEGISENSTTAKINQITFTADKLSPAIDESKVNTLTSSEITIENKSDVAADITCEVGTVLVTWDGEKDGTEEYGSVSYNDWAKEIFKLKVKGLDNKTIAAGASANITVELTWNTYSNDADADIIDTYFGMYATSVSFTITLTATQSSQLPTA